MLTSDSRSADIASRCSFARSAANSLVAPSPRVYRELNSGCNGLISHTKMDLMPPLNSTSELLNSSGPGI